MGATVMSASTMQANFNALLAALGAGAGTYTDKSLSIAAGGTREVLAASNSSRRSIIIQNPSSEIESIFINPTGNATANGDSIELPPGGLPLTLATTQAIDVLAATTGHKVIAKELA